MKKKVFRFLFLVCFSILPGCGSVRIDGADFGFGGGCDLGGYGLGIATTSVLSVEGTFYPTSFGPKKAVLIYTDWTETVCLDSDVEADVYVDKIQVGKTPFCGKIERGITTNVVLKADGYAEMKVPLKTVFHRRLTEKPISMTLKQTGVNILYSSAPSGTDMTYSSQGRWVEYQPNSYYVELTPPDKKSKQSSPDSRKRNKRSANFDRQIRDFALKNFYELRAEKPEYLKALATLSGLPQEEVIATVRRYAAPEKFAKDIVCLSENYVPPSEQSRKRSNKTENDIDRKITDFVLKNFPAIKKFAHVEELSSFTGSPSEELAAIVHLYATPEKFVKDIAYLSDNYVPLSEGEQSNKPENDTDRKITDFVLKNFSAIKKFAHIKELSSFTGLPEGRIREIAQCHFFPERFSKEVSLREKLIQRFAYRHFSEIKAENAKDVNALSSLSDLSSAVIKIIVRFYSTPETFAAEILRTAYIKAEKKEEKILRFDAWKLGVRESHDETLSELSALSVLPKETIIRRYRYYDKTGRGDSNFSEEISGYSCLNKVRRKVIGKLWGFELQDRDSSLFLTK